MSTIILLSFLLGFLANLAESFVRREQLTARVVISALVGGFALALFAWLLLRK